ncbi:MAG: hypothetical protein A3A80_03955 [Candidatus Terrybacteria bacterium RIFCSPLOWO2_01_FULL_44_24]|uniref:DUF5673 domain-containing protein n=1 Tax=Candidatus Terrybacteria bacterium RIFCSPHIGHO2_01_FULL_43_35 TaxID=1802361 RepID=A0A1G2PGF6_9BACT|nr:MAG: hypothetical protein A2828_02880 [Candidatus Terrybacteria bacterium RIFCSPHIGHO2_01_FULL_43_35]OHA50166.1 MAG: hypothetical protein A3B75_01540 [Candidatus Terrybacteria bacterium RIFCSPHIGHO2_02_FULL_43_14]OHA51225.1 MAG: hypothetical protein A3A80_03955 [Candidatus Terrybacteria bacterium RIFCSPLOWO2_01_FULL_44_24]
MPDNLPKNVVDLRNIKPLPAKTPADSTPLETKLASATQTNPLPQQKEAPILPFKLPQVKEEKSEPQEESDSKAATPVEVKETKREPEIIKHPDALMDWLAPEYAYHEKDKNIWAPAVLGIGSVLALISYFILKSFTSVLVSLIGTFTVLITFFKHPRTITFAITPQGVYAAKKLFSFDDLTAFWIFYHPPEMKEIALRSKKSFMPLIFIPLGDTDPNKIRAILIDFLKEEEQQLSITDTLARFLGL